MEFVRMYGKYIYNSPSIVFNPILIRTPIIANIETDK